jgi:hypothetical protein
LPKSVARGRPRVPRFLPAASEVVRSWPSGGPDWTSVAAGRAGAVSAAPAGSHPSLVGLFFAARSPEEVVGAVRDRRSVHRAYRFRPEQPRGMCSAAGPTSWWSACRHRNRQSSPPPPGGATECSPSRPTRSPSARPRQSCRPSDATRDARRRSSKSGCAVDEVRVARRRLRRKLVAHRRGRVLAHERLSPAVGAIGARVAQGARPS